jgi:Matrixin
MKRIATPVLLSALVLVTVTGCVVSESAPALLSGPSEPQDNSANATSSRWRTTPIQYCVIPSTAGIVTHERLVSLIGQAFDQWGVDSSYQGPCAGPGLEGNGRNEVYWGSLGSSEGPTRRAGEAQLRYVSCDTCQGAGSYIVEADLVVDPEPPASRRNEACVFTTLLHEVGHMLGAPHLAPPAVMASVMDTCPQQLTEADLRSIAHLY